MLCAALRPATAQCGCRKTGTAGEVARLFNQLAGETPPNGKGGLRVRPRPGGNGVSGASLNADQTLALLNGVLAVRRGDDAVRLPLGWPGVAGKVADAFNELVELNARQRLELARLSRVVGKEGKLKERASLGDVTGFWRERHGFRQLADRGPGASHRARWRA